MSISVRLAVNTLFYTWGIPTDLIHMSEGRGIFLNMEQLGEKPKGSRLFILGIYMPPFLPLVLGIYC